MTRKRRRFPSGGYGGRGRDGEGEEIKLKRKEGREEEKTNGRQP